MQNPRSGVDFFMAAAKAVSVLGEQSWKSELLVRTSGAGEGFSGSGKQCWGSRFRFRPAVLGKSLLVQAISAGEVASGSGKQCWGSRFWFR
jgi:hypothetical protein